MFPAHAGMSPRDLEVPSSSVHVPRARGDEPYGQATHVGASSMFPAHARMSPARVIRVSSFTDALRALDFRV